MSAVKDIDTAALDMLLECMSKIADGTPVKWRNFAKRQLFWNSPEGSDF